VWTIKIAGTVLLFHPPVEEASASVRSTVATREEDEASSVYIRQRVLGCSLPCAITSLRAMGARQETFAVSGVRFCSEFHGK